MEAYLRKAWLGFYTVLLGLRVTLKYLVAKPITLQYPDEKWEIPDGARGRLFNYIDDCIGCLACARACPVDCITVETKKPPKGLNLGKTTDGTSKKLVVPKFDIDISTCLYCGLCVEACPTSSITMTKEYEYSTYDRSADLLLHFGRDLDPAVEAAAVERAKQLEEAAKAEAERKAKEAPAKPKAENGGAKPVAEKSPAAKPAAEKPGASPEAPKAATKPEAEAPKPQDKPDEKPAAKPGEPDAASGAKSDSPAGPPKSSSPPGDDQSPS
jgi:NADH-quinone oxidoreductase chain I